MSSYNSDELQRLEPDYLDQYGLSEAPFSSILQDKFMFLDAERAQRLNMLQHMVRFSNLLLIVQGKTGVGKTALMRRFIQTAEDDWRVCEIAANTMIDAEQLLFQAAQGFGVRQLPQDSGELQEMLIARVATFHHDNQTPILIIDDAHELPKDALLAIFNLADAYVNDVNLLRIILFCEPQIEKIINSKDVKSLCDRVTHTMDVPPFNEDATAEYIKHRLAVVGFDGVSPFTPKVIKKIYRGSNGVAIKINNLAHEFLEQSEVTLAVYDDQKVEIDIEERKQAKPFVFVAALVILVALVLVFQDEINRLFDGIDSDDTIAVIDEGAISDSPFDVSDADEISETAMTHLDGPISGRKEESKEQIIKEINIQEKIISLANDKQDDTSTSVESYVSVASDEAKPDKPEMHSPATPDDNVASKTDEDTQVSESPLVQEKVVVPKITSISPEPISISREQQNLLINGEGFKADSRVVIGWTGKQKQLSDSQTRIISDRQIEIAITVGMDEDKWSIKVNSPNVGESNTFTFKVIDTQAERGLGKDNGLLAKNPAEFTLQLFGTNIRENADQFIKEHKIGQHAGYFYTKRKGQDWYSVVYGEYKDKSLANAAAKNLPTSLKKIKPWVRRFDDIQANINASRKLKATSQSRPASVPLKPKTVALPVLPSNRKSDNSASVAANQAWLWSQDPSNFTLQLLGARQATSIKKFLGKYNKLSGKAVYFHTRHDTRDWYAVVYGVYSDRGQAAKAIKRLPKELQSASPWIRSFGSIHAELDRAE